RAASIEELMDVPGVGEKLAASIKESLEDASLTGVNMTTGEIVD
ncbi:MAG: helix-hairpin-helix domain-containing protein, partial [Glutamicibacter sp.]